MLIFGGVPNNPTLSHFFASQQASCTWRTHLDSEMSFAWSILGFHESLAALKKMSRWPKKPLETPKHRFFDMFFGIQPSTKRREQTHHLKPLLTYSRVIFTEEKCQPFLGTYPKKNKKTSNKFLFDSIVFWQPFHSNLDHGNPQKFHGKTLYQNLWNHHLSQELYCHPVLAESKFYTPAICNQQVKMSLALKVPFTPQKTSKSLIVPGGKMLVQQNKSRWITIRFLRKTYPPFKSQPLTSPVYRVVKGWCPRGGCNWGILRIPREDWGTLANIREY